MPITINGSTGIAGIDGSAGTPALQGSDTNTGIFFPAADTVALTTAGAEVARATSDKYLRMATSTGGIQFNGDTAAVNALDDYEEGTFTPTIIGTTAAGTGTYSVQVGRYTKIGDQVIATGTIVYSAHTGTGNMRIAGLPVASEATTNNEPPVTLYVSNLTSPASTIVQARLIANTQEIALVSVAVAGGTAASLAIDTAATIYFTAVYESA